MQGLGMVVSSLHHQLNLLNKSSQPEPSNGLANPIVQPSIYDVSVMGWYARYEMLRVSKAMDFNYTAPNSLV